MISDSEVSGDPSRELVPGSPFCYEAISKPVDVILGDAEHGALGIDRVAELHDRSDLREGEQVLVQQQRPRR